MVSMVLLMHDVFPVQYMFYQMGATDINKKLTSAMLLIIWMCVVTVLNGSKYVKKQEKKKQNKKNLYILSRFLNKIEKNTVSMKKKIKIFV